MLRASDAAAGAVGMVDEAPNMVASPERIRAWVEHARSGDEFVYASRAGLFSARSAGMAEMRGFAERGLVELTQRPITGSNRRNYVARRTGKTFAEQRPPQAEATVRQFIEDEARAIDALLPILERAARFNRPCPTDTDLAKRTGIDRDEVKAVLETMADQGRIRVQAAPAPTLRFITIVATGHRTGMVG
jgi:hypothetical protein